MDAWGGDTVIDAMLQRGFPTDRRDTAVISILFPGNTAAIHLCRKVHFKEVPEKICQKKYVRFEGLTEQYI